MLFKNKALQKLGGGRLERIPLAVASKAQLFALSGHKDKSIVDLIRSIRKQRISLTTAFESYLIYSIARAQTKRPGAYAEVGVYQGASARLICEAKGDKPLHLFDTFGGLPPGEAADRGIHREAQYTCTLDSVQTYLNDYENVSFHKGLFPDSATGLENEQFAFAHIDVDLYQSTLDCLKFFYPRLTPGGILLSHDYSLLAGVQQAFDEFLSDKPESLIEQPTTQCMVVKL